MCCAFDVVMFLFYAGAYDSEDAAAHTYDLAALKYWGPGTILNFPVHYSIIQLPLLLGTNPLCTKLFSQ